MVNTIKKTAQTNPANATNWSTRNMEREVWYQRGQRAIPYPSLGACFGDVAPLYISKIGHRPLKEKGA
jgi:hypothetical protein